MLVQFAGFTGAVTAAVLKYSGQIKTPPGVSLSCSHSRGVCLFRSSRLLLLRVERNRYCLSSFSPSSRLLPPPGGVRTETGRGHRQRPSLVRVEERGETGIAVTMVPLLVGPLFLGVALQFALAPGTDEPGFYEALGFIVGAMSCVTYGVVTWAPRRSP